MHLIIFDIDGTLIDSHDFDSELYVESVREVLNLEIESEWSRYRNVTDSGILNQIIEQNNLSHSSADIHRKVRSYFIRKTSEYISSHAGILTEIPGAKNFLEILCTKKGVVLAIATGGWKETARMKLQAIGIKPDLFPIATASDSPSRLEILEIAERRALKGKTADKKTYFGDGPWDQTASEQLGYQFAAVGNKIESPLRITDFRDPAAILTKLGIK